MTDYDFPEVPDVEKAYRAAHRALESIMPPGVRYAPEADEPAFEVFSQFSSMVREAEMVLTGELGPRISWEGEPRERDWELATAGIDLDGGDLDFGVTLDESAYESDDRNWEGSSLDRAGRAYRRATQWDFAPGEAGIWLLTLAPTSAIGSGDKPWLYFGRLVGFVILYDRDKDGQYESVGHVWTPQAWRRRGIAARLLQEARSRFGASTVEGPFTDDGAALIRACWTEQEPAR